MVVGEEGLVFNDPHFLQLECLVFWVKDSMVIESFTKFLPFFSFLFLIGHVWLTRKLLLCSSIKVGAKHWEFGRDILYNCDCVTSA